MVGHLMQQDELEFEALLREEYAEYVARTRISPMSFDQWRARSQAKAEQGGLIAV